MVVGLSTPTFGAGTREEELGQDFVRHNRIVYLEMVVEHPETQ